ncbi:MAG: LamG domain-containing protein [Armatimonadota bacterium]
MKKYIFMCILIPLFISSISCSSVDVLRDKVSSSVNSELIAYYNFNEGAGDVLGDRSGYGNSGTIYGATWTEDRSGNGALYFDGVNDYVRIPADGIAAPLGISSLDRGTISVWFKFAEEAAPDGIFLPVFYMGPDTDAAATGQGLVIEVGHKGIWNTSQELFYTVTQYNNVNPTLCFDSGTDLTVNQWYHFAVTVSPDGNTGYLNGVEMTDREYNFGDNAFTNFFDSVTGGMLTIGTGRSAIDQAFYYFKGSIDDLRIYNRALSAAEVLQLYQMP